MVKLDRQQREERGFENSASLSPKDVHFAYLEKSASRMIPSAHVRICLSYKRTSVASLGAKIDGCN